MGFIKQIFFSRWLVASIALLPSFLKTGNSQTISRFNSFSYNVNDGLLQSNVLDIAFDSNNFCWLSFANGIQKFDGKDFITIPVQSGLPDDKWVNFFRSANGDLFISHTRGISKYSIKTDKFTQVYQYSQAATSAARFIAEDNGNIYFYSEKGNIRGLNSRTYQVTTDKALILTQYRPNSSSTPKISSNIINHRAAFLLNSVIYLWDLKNGRLIDSYKVDDNVSPFFMELKTEEEVMFYASDQAGHYLRSYDFGTKAIKTLSAQSRIPTKTFRSNVYKWGDKWVLSYYNNLFEVHPDLQTIKAEMVNFQNKPLTENPIATIKEDNFGNLYLVTISDGIKKIIRNNYPIKYYGTNNTADHYIVSLLPDIRTNRILAGTSGNGLLVFDTLQKLTKHIKTLPGRSQAFSPSVIIKDNKGDYIMFVRGEEQTWNLSNDLSKITGTKILGSHPARLDGVSYFGNYLYQNGDISVVQSGSNLYTNKLSNNAFKETAITESYTMSGILFDNKIVTHTNDELIFLDTLTFKLIKKTPFNGTGGVRCFAKDNKGGLYIGSNKGIFKIDTTGKVLLHLSKENGLPDECIYAMVFDNSGFLWCSSNKGLFKVDKNNSILQLKKEDGLQENEFNTNIVAKTETGELYFGGVNGISSFYPASISNFQEKINVLFTEIKVNNKPLQRDSATWTLSEINLPHDQNSLSFDFIAMSGNNPDQYVYQYKMEGVDNEWIQNDDMQTVRYLLPPGSYTLKIYASRLFDKDAKPLRQIEIIVNPPFWKAWWFITLMAVFVTILLALIITQYTERNFQKKLMVLENEHKIQLERERISRDLHDSVGAYANAVLYNIELLQNEQVIDNRAGLMSDLKFASKDIITALRETVWAFKKGEYSAQDCMLRIRNFIHPFNRYYQHINFKVEGDAPANKNLHSAEALNLVRIVQEAVTNSIKHSQCKNISIINNYVDNKWSLSVVDDGVGFDYENSNKLNMGNGLHNMKKRADESGFGFTVESSVGKGSILTVLIDS